MTTPVSDPFSQFASWFAEAEASEPNDPNAMALATVGDDGQPSVRMVLLKGWDQRGFVFYTNMESHKGRQLSENPHAALTFHWKSLRRQVRIEGRVERVSDAEADAYFASRPRESRIGAWASQQSRPLASRGQFLKDIASVTARYPVGDIPRPPHWTGSRVIPTLFEFWADRSFRLHERVQYVRAAVDDLEDRWTSSLLYP